MCRFKNKGLIWQRFSSSYYVLGEGKKTKLPYVVRRGSKNGGLQKTRFHCHERFLWQKCKSFNMSNSEYFPGFLSS